jgi:hypothetical protein
VRLEEHVALGIETHRPVVQIRRSHARDAVVGDRDLRVDLHVHALPRARVVDAQASVRVGREQPLEQSRAQHAHRRLFEPARARMRDHDDDLGAVRARERLGHRVADEAARQVLVLDVERALRRADQVDPCARDLGHRVAAAIGGLGARDRELDTLDVGLHDVRPRIALRVHGTAEATSRAPPALPCELAQRCRGGAVADELDVVIRRIHATPAVDAARILRQMLRGVPARVRHVHAPDERDLVVDDHELLVMGSRERMARVEPEVDAPVRVPAEANDRQQLAIERVQHREVPLEHPHVQRAAARRQRVEQRSELARKRRFAVVEQACAGVDVPAHDRDRTLRTRERVDERAVVVLRVDQDAHTRGGLHAPAVFPGACDLRGRVVHARKECKLRTDARYSDVTTNSFEISGLSA